MQVTNKIRNAVDISSSNKEGEHLPTTDRVFYTTAPRVKGVKHTLHELLRSQSKGHLIHPLKPGEPRKIIIKALPEYPFLYNPKQGEKTKGNGVPDVCNTTVTTNNPPVGTSLPAEESVDRCLNEILNDTVAPTAPPLLKKKRKRKRKRKRKNKEPFPIQHESKDEKGKNKSTKHNLPPAITTVTGSSPAGDHPSTSCHATTYKPPDPPSECIIITESTMGSLTQAIFRDKSHWGDQRSTSCIDLISSSEDSDVLSLLSTPSPIVSPHQDNLPRTTHVREKRSATEVQAEVSSKRVTKTVGDESVIYLKEVSCQTEKHHDELQVLELENHKKNSSKASEIPFSKMTDKALETRTTTVLLNEISSCSEAEVSLHGARPKINQKKRKRTRVSKLSLSQRMREDSEDESEETSETPVTSKFKRKWTSSQKDKLSVDFLNNVSECNSIQDCQKIDQKDSHEKDDVEGENKLASHSLACNTVDGVRIQNEKFDPFYTPMQKKTKTQPSYKTFLELTTGKRDITPEKRRVCGHTIIPETSESSVFSSSASLTTETSDLGNVGIEKISDCNNKILTEQRELEENPNASLSKLIGNYNDCWMNQSETAKGETDVPPSNPPISPGVSSISSASTETLHPVGKACLQNVALMFHDHFGGTVSESFEVLQKNSFNLLTTIQELQILHPLVKEALCSEADDESY